MFCLISHSLLLLASIQGILEIRKKQKIDFPENSKFIFTVENFKTLNHFEVNEPFTLPTAKCKSLRRS